MRQGMWAWGTHCGLRPSPVDTVLATDRHRRVSGTNFAHTAGLGEAPLLLPPECWEDSDLFFLGTGTLLRCQAKGMWLCWLGMS